MDDQDRPLAEIEASLRQLDGLAEKLLRRVIRRGWAVAVLCLGVLVMNLVFVRDNFHHGRVLFGLIDAADAGVMFAYFWRTTGMIKSAKDALAAVKGEP